MTTTAQETFYRPGLLFLSKHANLQFFITHAVFHTNPSGEREQLEPAIMAEFGDFSLQGNEFQDAEGAPRADIRGGAFDLDERAAFYGWTEDQREAVARKMLLALRDPTFRDFTLYEPPVPVAPWPNYDEMKTTKIPQIAEDLGLVGAALAYEQATHNRTSVINALEAKVQKEEEVATFEEQ